MNMQTFKAKTKSKPALLAAACGLTLLFLGCEKPSLPAACDGPPAPLTAQEQKLVGKWQLLRTDVYEISGVDSAGNYICSLVGSSSCDSVCVTTLTDQRLSAQQLRCFGSPGTCDGSALAWQAAQPNELVVNNQSFQVLCLAADSAVFTTVYVSDVLKLKSVLFYKRSN